VISKDFIGSELVGEDANGKIYARDNVSLRSKAIESATVPPKDFLNSNSSAVNNAAIIAPKLFTAQKLVLQGLNEYTEPSTTGGFFGNNTGSGPTVHPALDPSDMQNLGILTLGGGITAQELTPLKALYQGASCERCVQGFNYSNSFFDDRSTLFESFPSYLPVQGQDQWVIISQERRANKNIAYSQSN
jgi:hypothetical protein